MTVWEIILIGAGLAMDAVAVSIADGMNDAKMKLRKAVFTAGAFAVFQFFMPLVGYCCGAVFARAVETVAPVLSFLLLALIGLSMIFESLKSGKDGKARFRKKKTKSAGLKLLGEAFATSIDALAVGITLLAADESGSLSLGIFPSALIIGAVTFVLSFAAVLLGRKAGMYIADRAGILGGVVLLFIGVKIIVGGF